MSINSLSYIILMIFASVLFIYTLWKKKDSKLVMLYFAIAGLTYLVEYVIFVLFKSYEYNPQILTNNYYDNVFGAVASNGFTIPIVCVFVAAFSLRWKGKITAIFVILCIETLFLQLGVYKHYWYKTSFTGIGLLVFFFISQKFLFTLHTKLTQKFRFFTLFLASVLLKATGGYVLSGVLEKYIFDIGWFENPY